MSRIHGANSSDYHKLHTFEDITHQNVKTIMHLEDAAKANRDLTDRMADIIARFCGSTFVWGTSHLVWLMGYSQ